MLAGIDISNYQRDNYKYLIDNYGKDFVICRAAWRFSVDPMCDVMYQYAKSKGKKLGFYFFPLTSDGEPEVHAEWAYKQVLGYIGHAIPILDWEAYNGTQGTLDPSKVDWAKRWLDKFYQLSGVRPIIYMNSNCNSLYNFQSIGDGNYGLWIANYGTNSGKDNGRPAVKWWKSAAMHQYTSLGDNGKSLDRDTFYGDGAAWDAYAKSNKQTENPIETPVKTYTEAEVKQMIEAVTNDYQKQIDDTIEKLRRSETVIKNAKDAIEGIQNYGN